MDFAELMTLERRGADVFLGRSPVYPWGGVYGGQLVAQALRAASETVADGFLAHSLHTYYVRGGRSADRIVFEVQRTRDGRSFATRTVNARQEDRTLVTMTAGFHAGERAPDMQVIAAPAVAGPEAVRPGGWNSMFDCRFLPGNGSPGRVAAWMRLADPVADDPVTGACALAFMSDDVAADAVLALLYPERPPAADWESVDSTLFNHSLDHNIWFHRPAPPDRWQLQDFSCHAFVSGRGFVLGQIFDPEGTHLATVTQEVLVRARRDG